MNAREIIGHSEYFSSLSLHNREMLAALCALQTVEKGEYLFFEGRRGHSVYLLASGGIQLVKATSEGKDVVIKTVEPGEIFAEVILFENHSYPVTAVALKKSVVYKLPRTEFLRLLNDAGFRNEFIAVLMKRLRYLANRILCLTACDVEERFFRFLEEQYGRKELYTLTISKKDIAASIGATPETLSRLLLRLKREKKAQCKGKTLQLKNGFWIKKTER